MNEYEVESYQGIYLHFLVLLALIYLVPLTGW